MTPRIFSIEEVESLIPTLAQLVDRQQQYHERIETKLAKLARTTGKLPKTLAPDTSDHEVVAAAKTELRDQIAQYERGWREVSALGAVVKDPQIGLIDFYGRVDGKLVWLCWRHGEESLRYYHDLDTGFHGRKLLRPAARERTLN